MTSSPSVVRARNVAAVADGVAQDEAMILIAIINSMFLLCKS